VGERHPNRPDRQRRAPSPRYMAWSALEMGANMSAASAIPRAFHSHERRIRRASTHPPRVAPTGRHHHPRSGPMSVIPGAFGLADEQVDCLPMTTLGV
jgi:hypothetical protein